MKKIIMGMLCSVSFCVNAMSVKDPLETMIHLPSTQTMKKEFKKIGLGDFDTTIKLSDLLGGNRRVAISLIVTIHQECESIKEVEKSENTSRMIFDLLFESYPEVLKHMKIKSLY